MNVGAENAHETGLAGRYATAMFELAQDDKSVDAVAADGFRCERRVDDAR